MTTRDLAVAMPAGLAQSTVQMALRFAAGPAAAGGSAECVPLAEAVLRGALHRVNIAGLVLLGLLATLGAGVYAHRGGSVAPANGSADPLALDGIADARLRATLQGHQGTVRTVAFSPDGALVVTGGLDATAKLWNPAGGRELDTLRGHGQLIYEVMFSPDGKTLITGSEDMSLRFWNVASRRSLGTIPLSERLYFLALSRDGRTLATN